MWFGGQSAIGLVRPGGHGGILIPLDKDFPSEQEDGVNHPQHKENGAGDDGVQQRFSCKAEQQQKRGDHHHGGEVGKNVQAGGGGAEAGVDFLGEDHAVGSRAGQGAEAHQEELMLKALEAFLGNQADVHKGDHRAHKAEDHDGQDVVLDIVDLNGGHARNDHQVEGEAGDAVHLIIVDVVPVHDVALAKLLDHKADQHGGQGRPQEVEAPGDAVGEIGKDAQQVHKAKGEGVGQGHKAGLQGELVHGFVVRQFAVQGGGIRRHFHRQSGTDRQVAPLFVDVDVQHAKHGRHHKADRGQRQAEAAVAGKLGGGSIGEVDVPAEGVAGALTKGKGEDKAADIGNDLVPIAGEEEHHQRDAQAHKGLQHIGAALQRAELQHLRPVGLVGALFGFQGHGRKADGQAMVGDHLHEPVIHQRKAKLLANDVHNQQERAAQKGGGHQTFPEQGDGAPEDVAHHQEQQKQPELHHERPHSAIVGHGKIPAGSVVHLYSTPCNIRLDEGCLR